jgi:hypothetical protein
MKIHVFLIVSNNQNYFLHTGCTEIKMYFYCIEKKIICFSPNEYYGIIIVHLKKPNHIHLIKIRS